MSNIAFLMDLAETVELDFGLIYQNISSKRLHYIIESAIFLYKIARCDKIRNPYLFAHPNPINAIISWIISIAIRGVEFSNGGV